MKQRKKINPCCVGCGIMTFVFIGLMLALGIFVSRFARENVTFFSVAHKQDPPLTAEETDILPATAGDFTRGDIEHDLSEIPQFHDVSTSGMMARYQDSRGNAIRVVVGPTEEVLSDKQLSGWLSRERKADMELDKALAVKEPFVRQPKTIVMWYKKNWAYFLETTSTVAGDFLEDFSPVTTQTHPQDSLTSGAL